MKNSGIIFIVFLLLLSSCKKVDKTIDFDLNYQTNFVVNKSIPIQTLTNITSDPVATHINDILDSKNSSLDLVNKIKLTKVKLTIIDPANENFDFLSDVDLYLEASGLPKIRIAWKNQMVNNLGSTIELILLSDDLQSYFKKDDVTLELDVNKDEMTSQNITIKTEVFLEAEADLLGS